VLHRGTNDQSVKRYTDKNCKKEEERQIKRDTKLNRLGKRVRSSLPSRVHQMHDDSDSDKQTQKKTDKQTDRHKDRQAGIYVLAIGNAETTFDCYQQLLSSRRQRDAQRTDAQTRRHRQQPHTRCLTIRVTIVSAARELTDWIDGGVRSNLPSQVCWSGFR